MPWLRRVVTLDVAVPPLEVAGLLMDEIRRTDAIRLSGQASRFGFEFHSEWRPSLPPAH